MIFPGRTPLRVRETGEGLKTVTPESHELGEDLERVFPSKEWLFALNAIRNARTYSMQYVAMSAGILAVATLRQRLVLTEPRRFETIEMNPRARYALESVRPQSDGGEEPKLVARLRSVRMYTPAEPKVMGYQSQRAHKGPQPFSILDTPPGDNPTVHEVVWDPNDRLSETAQELSEDVVYWLAHELDEADPGFDVFAQLEASSAPIDVAEL